MERFADKRFFAVAERLFAFRQFVEAIGQQLYRENFFRPVEYSARKQRALMTRWSFVLHSKDLPFPVGAC
jgi:hypothetical protein